MLLPGFLSIAERTGKPLVLSEVGASAGLNLQFDRYRYRLGDFAWGEQSDVFLSPEWRGGTRRMGGSRSLSVRDATSIRSIPLRPRTACG